MTPRLAAKVEVSALIRRVEGIGGTGMVLARGDDRAGTILLYIAERGAFRRLLERRPDETGAYRWDALKLKENEDNQEVNTYIARRRAFDGDLWVVELDVAGSERFIAEMIAVG